MEQDNDMDMKTRARHADGQTDGRRAAGRRRRERHAAPGKAPETVRMPADDPFDEETMETMAREFRHDRRANGPGRADADWSLVPMDEWLGHLTGCSSAMEDETLAALVVVMTETLSMRDALILSMIADGECDREELLGFVARPHDPLCKRRMHLLLSEGFDDPLRAPDEERCRLGIDLLGHAAVRAPVRFAVQPLAVVAYVLWWMGDGRAVEASLQCLALDGECSLAAIVFAAAHRGAWPAWCR